MKLSWLTNNWWLKIGALILAVILWFYVAGEETVETTFKMPIQLKLAEEMAVTEQSASEVDAAVRGRRELIDRMMGQDLICYIDLTVYEESGTIVLPVEGKFLSLNPDLAVIKIRPEHLKIKIDRLIQKVLPVKLVTVGGPAPGYRMVGFAIDPVSALIKGPQSYLQNRSYVETESVDITGRRKSFKKMVPLESVPMEGSKVPPQFVEVVVQIEKTPEDVKVKSKK